MLKTFFRVLLYSTLLVYLSKNIVYKTKIDQGLKPYFNNVMMEVTTRCNKGQYYLPDPHQVVFENMDINTYGYCSRRLNGFKIAINKKVWETELEDEADRYQLIIHEAMHCLFREPHRNDPDHFMHANFNKIPGSKLAIQFWSYLDSNCKR